jgi:hypothetical protein
LIGFAFHFLKMSQDRSTDKSLELTILIIRHAEKPDRGWPGPGLSSTGEEDAKSLVIRGWQRAGAWAAFFGRAPNEADYPRPASIYAANPTATANDDHDDEPSQRPFQTVSALAARLKIDPITNFAVGEEQQLSEAVLKQSGVVLIAWEHKAILRTLVPNLFNKQIVTGVLPKKWDGTRFDVVLRCDRDSSGTNWTFRQLCPCLLSNDSALPMADEPPLAD